MGPTSNVVVGSSVWVEDDELAWMEAEVVAVEKKKVTIRKRDELVTLKMSKCHPKDQEVPDGGVDDMVKLAYLHEPGVLHNLFARYSLDEIYTYTGNILIAVNPFQRLPHLYNEHMMEQYKGVRLGELSPHVFAIADTAYRAMVDYSSSQAILVSGESGAGKTETTKLIMQYLAYMGGRASTDGRTVESQVLESNPLLEAFGNAKTVRNNNSSRFGKFVEIQFDRAGRISGAAVRTYLLERSRVVQISDPERNYHCFYQLCAGASPEEVKRLKLAPAETFHYLNQSTCFELPGKLNNAQEYLNTRRAMEVVGLSPEEQEAIFRVVAAILHLGNISFVPGKQMDSSKLASDNSKFHLEAVAELLCVEKKQLRESLITRTLVTREGNIKRDLDPVSSTVSRDTLAKTIYARLFDWLVDKINKSIGQDPKCMALIGVLDIYGFESFEVNSFEQFCINLANEKLQQHFNQHVFKSEQEEYEREEINWSYIEFVDNQDVLELIEKKPMGIIALLDEQCMFPKSTPETFATKLYQTLGTHKRFEKPKLSQIDFTIDHYAGKVMYQTELFLDKNKDYVVMEHQDLLGASKDPFVAALFPAPIGDKTKTKFTSLGSSFKQQLSDLMSTLNTTEPHYIRCVKPNSKNQPGLFENHNVLQQLRCGGVLEAIRISCAGYPTRRTFDEFLDRFSMLAPDLCDGSLEDKVAVTTLLEKFKFSNFQVGKTQVFLRAGQMADLDALRAEKLNESARVIQRCILSWLQRRQYIRLRSATIRTQACWRGVRARKMYQALRRNNAAVKIQKAARGFVARRKYARKREAAITIQAGVRGMFGRRRFAHLRRVKAATTIQASWRRHRAESQFLANKRAAITFQSAWRGRRARLELRQLKFEARQTGALQEAKTKLEKQCEELTWRLQLEKRMRTDLEESKAQEVAKLQKEVEEARSALEEAAREKEVLVKELADRPTVAVASPLPPSSSTASSTGAQARAAPVVANKALVEGEEEDEAERRDGESVAEGRARELALENERLKALLDESDSRTAHMEEKLMSETTAKSKQVEELQVTMSRMEERMRELEQENQMLRQQALLAATSSTPQKSMQRTTSGTGGFFGRQLENGADHASPVPSIPPPESTKHTPTPIAPSTPGSDASTDFELKRQKMLVDRQQHDQEALMKSLATDLGFDEKRPMAACIIFKALLHWRSLESERTNVFERILHAIKSGIDNPDLCAGPNERLAYWLSNTSALLCLLNRTLKTTGSSMLHSQRRRASASATPTSLFGRMTQSFRSSPQPNVGSTDDGKGIHLVEAKYPALLFKQHLSAYVEKLYGLIRDNLKKEISPMLGSCIQAPKTSRGALGRHQQQHLSHLSAAAAAGHAVGASVAAASSPRSSQQQALSTHWSTIISSLTSLLNTLKATHVPPFLVRKLFSQIFSYINVQLFNSLLLRRECCSFSNGEYVKAGLAELEHWIYEASSEYAGSAWDELRFIRQAVGFLVIHQKPKKSLEEITSDLCPVLSMQQLYRISTMYWDDKYGTHSVSPEVISAMRTKMTENSSSSGTSSFLLDDDSSIPFSMDEIFKGIPDTDLRGLQVPPQLRDNHAFVFIFGRD